MKYATSIPAIGAVWGASGTYENVTFLLDGNTIFDMPLTLWFWQGQFNLEIEFPTTSGVHDFCAESMGLAACFDLIVCSTCNPRLGFVDQFNISSATRSYLRGSPISIVGDDFPPESDLTIWIDTQSNQTLLARGIIVQPNGRFEVGVKLPGTKHTGLIQLLFRAHKEVASLALRHMPA